jgi:energy-converting hydrogenase B subunit D
MTNPVSWIFDLLLALSLVGIAWRILAAAGLFQAIVLFIAFGLMMSLAWARLAAPDVALAEAAIGAGLAGVLLLDALRHIRSGGKGRKRSGHA